MKTKKHWLIYMAFALSFCISGSKFCGPEIVSVATHNTNMQNKSLVVGGKCVGVTLCTNGVLVTDISDIACDNGKHLSPAKDAGLKPGDLIQSFNNQTTLTVDDLNTAIKASQGTESTLKFIRDKNEHVVLITPQLSQADQDFKIGAWVKDAASGIGTITYFDPQTNEFAALGHGICDSDTGQMLKIDKGNIYTSSIVSVNKGEKGIPGELNGIFDDNSANLGEITKNISSGIFGTADSNFLDNTYLLPVGTKIETIAGKAEIMSNIEGQKIDKFNIEIVRILPNKLSVNKGMIIKITDQRLLDKTGGIVRGMSGSPIIQNGKIVGAVTHVFVNDPTRGYGIFIEDMLEEANKIK